MLAAIGNIENTGSFLTRLSSELDNFMPQKATGKLILRKQRTLLEIYLFAGRLQYVVDRRHRVRRWQRALKQYCPHWFLPLMTSLDPLWEYELLSQGISQKQLTLAQVKGILQSITQECLLEIAHEKSIEIQWKPEDKSTSTLSYCLTLSTADIHHAINQVKQMEHEWIAAGLVHISPSLTPIATQKLELRSPFIPLQYLDGQLTFWDIAQEVKKSVVEVASCLRPWIDKNMINLREIQDLPTPQLTSAKTLKVASENTIAKPSFPTTKTDHPRTSKVSVLETNSHFSSTPPDTSPLARVVGHKAVIACIDDSPVVTHNLKQLLSPMGYQVITIQEPMAGFAKLIKYQPDAILLDLNMPNADGYSVCKFLRETPVFCQTPIIILTSQDTMIDRTRAKLAGATDFLAKPPKAKELLQMLDNLLVN
ncbi:response regulator receiver protein [Rippkaea orientalis PCC 8801]|uniref:Protein PatA n=1 Tax=Rippkaea orientalis (strain PCC 8801 / RF-1) TaxID=41431 RepID=B7JYH3_RIPO1|nr:response regulator [Rippkaea orientalis]ACK64843.1 response regulator receiver protein [Rippkaea orientalis PCC 8801]